jgi:hypothetical protein
MGKGKVEYKDFKDLKSKSPIPVVQGSVPGPGLLMNQAPPFDGTKKYSKKDVVSWEGHNYRSTVGNNSQTPSATSASWTLIK